MGRTVELCSTGYERGCPRCAHSLASFAEALAGASRDEGFGATVYAMNTLLIQKGVYTQDEFQSLFVEWVRKERTRKRPGGATPHSV